MHYFFNKGFIVLSEIIYKYIFFTRIRMLLTRLCLQIAQLPLSYQYHPSHHQHSLKKEVKVQGLLMMREVVVIFQHQYREILELHQLAHLLLTKIAYPQSKYLRTPADQFHQVCKEFNCNICLLGYANRPNYKHLIFFPIYFSSMEISIRENIPVSDIIFP